jgi:hypothetical protein
MTDNTMRRWSTRLLQPPRRMIDRNRVSRFLHQSRDATRLTVPHREPDHDLDLGTELGSHPRCGALAACGEAQLQEAVSALPDALEVGTDKSDDLLLQGLNLVGGN